MSQENLAIVKNYFDAVARGDLEALARAFSDDIVWHQPGAGVVSGRYDGKDAVFGLVGGFMQRSGGTFRIDDVGGLMANGDLVVAPIHFRAEAQGKSMSMNGVDVLRLENGVIKEVWLFSEDQAAEDAFWG